MTWSNNKILSPYLLAHHNKMSDDHQTCFWVDQYRKFKGEFGANRWIFRRFSLFCLKGQLAHFCRHNKNKSEYAHLTTKWSSFLRNYYYKWPNFAFAIFFIRRNLNLCKLITFWHDFDELSVNYLIKKVAFKQITTLYCIMRISNRRKFYSFGPRLIC